MPARDRSRHHGHVGVVAVADPDGFLVLEVDAVERLDERRDEMPPRLLAVGHDVDAGTLLVAQHEPHGIALALAQGVALEPPRRPQHAGVGKPGGLGQAAGDRRRKDLGHGEKELVGGRGL
jgi:hypothetical protein